MLLRVLRWLFWVGHRNGRDFSSLYSDQAFVTLTTNDAYAQGALVLGSSLKQHGTTRRLAVLTTPQVSDAMR